MSDFVISVLAICVTVMVVTFCFKTQIINFFEERKKREEKEKKEREIQQEKDRKEREKKLNFLRNKEIFFLFLAGKYDKNHDSREIFIKKCFIDSNINLISVNGEKASTLKDNQILIRISTPCYFNDNNEITANVFVEAYIKNGKQILSDNYENKESLIPLGLADAVIRYQN